MGRRLALSATIALCLTHVFATAQAAASAITIAVSPEGKKQPIGSDYIGLSYEGGTLVANASGGHLFAPTNTSLLNMFRTLGVKNLRIGGNSSERLTTASTDADRAALFQFAQAGNLNVVFNLRMKPTAAGETTTDQAYQIAIAETLARDYSANLQAIEIGNEPDNGSFTDYNQYRSLAASYMSDVLAQPHAGNVVFVGPSATSGRVTTWPALFSNDFGPTGKIKYVTQHWYSAGNSQNVTDQAAERKKILAATFPNSYLTFYNKFVPAVEAAGLPYRLEETNTYSIGGASGVSDTYAATLWGLDYMYWWAAHGAIGVNFHTGGFYDAIQPRTVSATYVAKPLAYALKAFDLGGHGNLVPLTITNTDNVNITAYAAVDIDNSMSITLINKSFDAAGRDATVSLDPGRIYKRAKAWTLRAPANDVSVITGITIGGASINGDGSWAGAASRLSIFNTGRVTVSLPMASAVVVRLE